MNLLNLTNERGNNQISRINEPTYNEQRVIRQLIEAILFEQVIDYRYQLGRFTFSLGEDHYQAQGFISAFGRIRLDAKSIRQRQGEQLKRPLLNNIVSNLPTTSNIKQRLLQELEQTILLSEWNRLHLPVYSRRTFLCYQELEAAINEGHTYHPCFKARTGFSTKDHQHYGPESANQFKLHWLAIDRRFLKQRLDVSDALSDDQFWLAELGEETWQRLTQKMNEQNCPWQVYSLLPIHPWQWASLQPQLAAPLSQKHLVHLGEAGDCYQATISVRTLLNVSNPHKANIKLPMNMVNSSSLRTIEPHSICTAPLLSQWLVKLVGNDPFFQQHPLSLLPEYAGLTVLEPIHSEQPQATAAHWTSHLAGQLGVIFRQSLEYQQQEKTAVPFVALALIERDGKPFIHPWIEHYGCEKWLNQLIKAAVIPVWHLLVKHGICLETHAQNMVLSHDNGWPKKVILRDFHESLEYVESYLADSTLAPDFKSLEPCYEAAQDDQFYWMESVEALRELLVDTLFVYNLTELSLLLEQHYQYSEADFWQQVYNHIQAYQAEHHCDPSRIKKIDIYQARVQTESLIKKKLSGKVDQEFHHTIDNPLASLDRVTTETQRQQKPLAIDTADRVKITC